MHFRISLLTQMVHANRNITLATAFDQAEHVIIHSRRIKHMLLQRTKHIVLYAIPYNVEVHPGSRSTFSLWLFFTDL